MSFTTEQPGVFDFEVCCICSDEFSNDTALAEHLVKHTEESAYQTTDNSDNGEQNKSATDLPTTFPSGVFTEYNESFQKSENSNPSDNFYQENSARRRLFTGESDTFTEKVPAASNYSFQSGSEGLKNQPFVQNYAPRSNRTVGRPFNRQNYTNSQVLTQRPGPRATYANNGNVNTNVASNFRPVRSNMLPNRKPVSFSCHICSKKFAFKGALQEHLQMHVSSRLMKCPHCRKRFTMKKVLKKHCEEMHGIIL